MLVLFLKMLPLLLLSLAGYLLCKKQWVDATFNRQLSLVMLNVFYPGLIISSILRNFTFETLLQNWAMPVGTVFILVTGLLIGRATLPLLRKEPVATKRCYLFVSLMNNYSFLPILMAAALWDEKAVALIAFSALGSELCVWTLGLKALTGQRLDRSLLKNLLSMPMLALGLSFILLALKSSCTRYGWLPAEGSTTDTLLKTLLQTCFMAGGATIPASALICGARIGMLHPTHLFSALSLWTSFLRLVIIPAVCIGLLLLIPMPSEIKRVLILIATMPVAMASITLAEAYNGDANFSAATVFLSHLLCLITVPLWLALVNVR